MPHSTLSWRLSSPERPGGPAAASQPARLHAPSARPACLPQRDPSEEERRQESFEGARWETNMRAGEDTSKEMPECLGRALHVQGNLGFQAKRTRLHGARALSRALPRPWLPALISCSLTAFCCSKKKNKHFPCFCATPPVLLWKPPPLPSNLSFSLQSLTFPPSLWCMAPSPPGVSACNQVRA